MKKERNYGIDLLRLIMMFMVCILHTLGQGGILNALAEGTARYKLFWLIEITAFCAVDSFAFISGYMASDKPKKYSKLVEMWFQAFFYSFVLTALFALLGIIPPLGKKALLKCAMPVTFEKFWYFSAFFCLFFAAPILNRFLFSVEERTAKKAFLILFILFSIIGTVSDPFNLNWGYTALWIIVLYCIGVLAQRIRLFEERKSIFLIIIWAVCIAVTWAARMYFGVALLTSYVSPTVLLCGMISVVLFSRLKLKGNVISKLSPLAFGIYLFQLNQVNWSVFLNGRFAFVADKPAIVGVLLVLLFSSAIFASGMAVEFIRSKAASLLRIPVLSEKIVSAADYLMEKAVSILK